VTPEEQADVPHHLLSFVDPTTEYSVLDFMADATRAVRQLFA
jgi:tRNA A37 N6-isopentenylltransferase MiaA